MDEQVQEAVVEEVKPVKSRQRELQEFTDKYKELCNQYQAQIVVSPVLVPTNHGTFEIAQDVRVGEMPKQN